MDQLPIDSEFWDLITQLTALVYHTEASERLGTVFDFLNEAYPDITRPTKQRIENHVLRTVAWIEYFEDRETFGDWR